MMTKSTILIVDDEATIREVVRKYLELEGYRVIEADTGPLALQLLREEKPDLVVLDIMLPGLDGFTITRSLRGHSGSRPPTDSSTVPIIMLTARTQEADRVMGFELGTDDYVTKPFSPRELVMRVKAVLRRSITPTNGADHKSLEYGDLRLDAATHIVQRGTTPISLTATEFDLLWFLASHPRQVFSRAQLLEHVWGYDFYGDDSTVTVHIRRLREKIETDPGNPECILTVWGVGYKFEPPLS
ncbi:MAG: response regulator transcription factor [Chloroflexi bacterium]|nr:response regulator transcription factor [Chloroflexota bacterium]